MKISEILNPEKEYFQGAHALIFDLDGTLIDSMRFWRPEDKELIGYASILDYMREKYTTSVEPKLYAAELLTLLKENGVPFCIATDTPFEIAKGFFKRHNLASLADFYISSEDIGHSKFESPEIYFESARRMGVAPSECVVFEDYPTSVLSAKNASFTTVGVYDEISRDDMFTLKRLCDDYIYNLQQIMRR